MKDGRLSTISDYFLGSLTRDVCVERSAFDRCNSYFDNARLVMNFSGMIRLWEQKNRTWPLMEVEPRDIWGVYNFCGKFGSCNPNNKLACKCLPWFMLNVPKKWHFGDFLNGCTRNDQSYGDRNTFLSLKMMIGGENPQGFYQVNNKNECKETCLNNSECNSYSYDEQRSCQIWMQDLLNLQEEYLALWS